MTGVQTCALPIYTDQFSLGKRPRFLYCPILNSAAPPFFILTGSAINFLMPGSPWGCAPAFYTAHFLLGSAPAFYTDQFSLRQRPRFLYCPFLVAAAHPLFILTGSAMNFLLPPSPDRKSTRLNSSHMSESRMPSSA